MKKYNIPQIKMVKFNNEAETAAAASMAAFNEWQNSQTNGLSLNTASVDFNDALKFSF